MLEYISIMHQHAYNSLENISDYLSLRHGLQFNLTIMVLTIIMVSYVDRYGSDGSSELRFVMFFVGRVDDCFIVVGRVLPMPSMTIKSAVIAISFYLT